MGGGKRNSRVNPNAGHRERVRRRVLNEGITSFAPHEVLEAILLFSIPRRDVKPIAKALLEHFGTLPGVLEASAEELKKVEGIGESSAALLSLFLPVMRRYHAECESARPVLRTITEAALCCWTRLEGIPEEKLLILGLDGGSRLRGCRILAEGAKETASAAMRQILDFTLATGATQIVLAHNHPGGRCEASLKDIESTNTLREALALLDVRLIEHIILCEGKYVCASRPDQVYTL